MTKFDRFGRNGDKFVHFTQNKSTVRLEAKMFNFIGFAGGYMYENSGEK